jgi:hypothetical protein
VDEMMRFAEQPRKWKLDFDQLLLCVREGVTERAIIISENLQSEIYAVAFWLRPRKCISSVRLM